MEPTIVIKDLTKQFRGRLAVDHLNLAIPPGSIFALLGDNGAGKTTTIRMLTGLLQPDAGDARILGENCWANAVMLRHRIGYVPEKPRFYDWMKVQEIGWFTAGFHDATFLPRFLELAHNFKLDANARLSTLSKGQYAKVALALALSPDPEVLILDEPTSGLDLFVRREFLTSMVDLAGAGRTILISSHQVAEIERIASHVAFMADGKLLLTATMDELRTRIVRLRLRFEQHPPDAGSLGKVLQRNGTGKQWQAVIQDPNRDAITGLQTSSGVFDFEETPLGLEDVYVALMGKQGDQP